MPANTKLPKKRKPRFILLLEWVAIPITLALLLAIGGFSYAALKETNDPFCASCHTEPEATFYERSIALPVDLASAHSGERIRCIDCHSGKGWPGRMRAELLGAKNLVAHVTGTAEQPSRLSWPLPDTNCTKCHAQVLKGKSKNNHYHFYIAEWQDTVPDAGGCVNCHPAHATDVRPALVYMNEVRTTAVCDTCHVDLEAGKKDRSGD